MRRIAILLLALVALSSAGCKTIQVKEVTCNFNVNLNLSPSEH